MATVGLAGDRAGVELTESKIEWTDATWNPVTGCSKVSPGCAHCYAEATTQRYAGRPGWPAEFLPWTPDNAAANVVLHPDRLDAPLRWKKPRRVFVNSMSDLFHELVPNEFIGRVFEVMMLTPQHAYQILTKRPERMREFMGSDLLKVRLKVKGFAMGLLERDARYLAWPLPNVWLGTSVENQHWADERIPLLIETPAAVRFLSCEPLLGPVDLSAWLGCRDPACDCAPWLDWVIVGGESGPKHRPFDPQWARDLVAQCEAAGVAAFVKQMGGARPGTALEDLPPELRVRDYPR